MSKLEILLGPKVGVDEDLFKVAPLQTLKQLITLQNRRLLRLELIVLAPYLVDIGLKVM